MLMSRHYKPKESSQIPIFVLQAAGLPYSPPLPPPPLSRPPLLLMSQCPKERENRAVAGVVGLHRCHEHNGLSPALRASGRWGTEHASVSFGLISAFGGQ